MTGTSARRMLTLSLAAIFLLSKDVAAADAEPSWGTSSTTTFTVPFTSFVPMDAFTVANMGVSTGGNGTVCNDIGGTCRFSASVSLPNGAKIVGLDLEACDAHLSRSVNLVLSACPKGTSSCTSIANVDSDNTGCAVTSSASLSTQVDNTNNYYVLLGTITDDSISLLARAARVRYQLQLSPAPATATFADVPTNYIYFRAIEALAASGITSGCGGGNFCPNQPVTRGELAKFLANALGLYWPN